MLDSIKQFFQAIYDSTIGFSIGIWDSFVTFLSNSWDVVLIVFIIGLVFAVFKLLRYLTVPAIILGQIIMLTALIASMVAFVVLLSASLVSIYNRIFDLANLISNSSTVGCLGYGIDCLGISGVLSGFFTELFALFIVVLLIRVSSIFYWAMNIVSDKLWRIGVLLSGL